jgi:ketosteroid isomerase-like protein
MKNHRAFAALALASFTALALAGPSPMDVAKKAAADYRNATLKKDFASFEKTSTPDFVYVDAHGVKVPRAQALEGMKTFYGPMKWTKVKVVAVSAKLADGGIVYIQEEWSEGKAKMGGPKESLYTSHSKDEVHMVKKGGKWLTKMVKNLKTDMKIDGKKMPGM